MTRIGIHSVGTSTLTSWRNEPQGPKEWWTVALANPDGPLRDRPQPRPPRTGTDWMDQDFAARYGLWRTHGADVVFLDLFFGSAADNHPVKAASAYRGATAAGIAMAPQPDTDSWNGAMKTWTDAQVVPEAVRHLKALYDINPGTWEQEKPGELLLSPYDSQLWTGSRWRAICDAFAAATGKPVAFWPIVKGRADAQTLRAGFGTAGQSRFAGYGFWGARSPKGSAGALGDIRTAHADGLGFSQYVGSQDYRPRDRIFDEARNTELLRQNCRAAIDGAAERILVTTGDDIFEHSHLDASVTRGPGWLQLFSYYARWAHTGRQPAITADAVFLSHRLQPWAAQGSASTKAAMRLRSGSDPAVDEREVVVFLTADADVTVDGGTPVPCKAGMTVLPRAPLTLGRHQVSVTRGGLVVGTATSREPVQPSWPAQRLDYAMATNLTGPGWHADAPTSTLDWAWPIDTAADPVGRVRNLQTALGLPVDGRFGNDTLTAVEKAVADLQTARTSIANAMHELGGSS